jgi:FMN phosphatase YigB (HAD superfamily)
MLRNIKGFIFDFDGTLFDSAGFGFHLIAACPADMFRIWKERFIRSKFSGRDYLTKDKYLDTFFSEMSKICFGRPPEKLKAWYYNRYIPRMIKVLKKHFEPRPGFNELFQYMDSSTSPVKAAVYSDYPFLKERMESLGLKVTEQIHLYGPESFGAQKPAVRPFLQIAKELDLPPEEILVIGDREETDGLGAFNSGMHFFCLETGRRKYYNLDPNRRRPKGKPQGPSLLMYAGAWDGLRNLLVNEKFKELSLTQNSASLETELTI